METISEEYRKGVTELKVSDIKVNETHPIAVVYIHSLRGEINRLNQQLEEKDKEIGDLKQIVYSYSGHRPNALEEYKNKITSLQESFDTCAANYADLQIRLGEEATKSNALQEALRKVLPVEEIENLLK